MPDKGDIVVILSKDIDEVLNWVYNPNTDLSIATLEKIRLILRDESQNEVARCNAAEVIQAVDLGGQSDDFARFLQALYATLIDVCASPSVALRSAARSALPNVLEALKNQ